MGALAISRMDEPVRRSQRLTDHPDPAVVRTAAIIVHGEECHVRGGFGEVVTFSGSSHPIDIPGRQGLYVQFDDYALPNRLR
jgi:hypothetical protein